MGDALSYRDLARRLRERRSWGKGRIRVGGNELAAILEAIDAAAEQADEGWRPIESAPIKNGERFLAVNVKSGVIAITWSGKASHVPLYGWCFGEDGEDIDLWQPTHWRPLPAAPSDREGETTAQKGKADGRD